MITTKGIPDLKEPEKYSEYFRDFVSLCLEKSPEKRPTAEELLQHPFMETANEGVESLVRVIERAKELAKEEASLPF